jgi:glutamine amidotransferase|tara:strand:- start:122 stop:757 length:636 start_codon:yes stop_codon:yes gene_type:complete
MLVTVIDYGSGNLRSAAKALEKANKDNNLKYNIQISSDPKLINKSDKIVLPGQGSFKDCKEGLSKITGLIEELNEYVLVKKKLIFGICVGMQLFATYGLEEKKTDGFNWIKGKVKKINIKDSKFKLPHMGWNEIELVGSNKYFSGIKDLDHMYFIHSYEFEPEEAQTIKAYASYNKKIVVAIEKNNIFGTQFHPEKSQDSGLKILGNFLKI